LSDRSFVRFGGLAGMLLAFTSWAAVVAYFTVAKAGTDRVGMQVYELLYALVAVWSLFAIVAVHQRARAAGEAWSFFATLIGVAAGVGTVVAATYEVASVRTNAALSSPSPVDPLHVLTFGLTGLWFLIANLLLRRTATPRVLVLLGFVAAADLFLGFFGALSDSASLVTLASIVAGGVGGPIYWLWLGLDLRRHA
jgi:hypothetical protein